jgi:hypothetical protein
MCLWYEGICVAFNYQKWTTKPDRNEPKEITTHLGCKNLKGILAQGLGCPKLFGTIERAFALGTNTPGSTPKLRYLLMV